VHQPVGAALVASIALSLAAACAPAQGGSPAVPSAKRHDHILPRAECFFGLHFDLHPNASDTELGAAITEENIAALIDRVNPDFVQYDCKGHPGYTGYPTKIGWPSPGIVKDSLAIWRKVTRERNVGLYIHYSGLWDTVAIAHHPDWARVDAAGNRDANMTSVFGPYADALLIPQLDEVVSAYGLDGLWVDGECWAAQLDWSDAARAAFTAETGIADAPTSSSDPHWLDWKTFHRRAFERYLGHWVDAIHARHPDLQVTSNWAYSTHMPVAVRTNVDFLSGDFSSQLWIDRARVDSRYLASTGKPWDLMMWGFTSAEGTRTMLTPLEHQCQEAGVVLMQGGAFQVNNPPERAGYLAPFLIETLGRVADFCRARQDLSFGSTSVPQVALLLSSESQFDRSDAVFLPEGCAHELEGALDALLELHYSVDILAEHQLEPRLAEFPLVVVPDSHKLADSFRAALVAYVRAGGSLLLMGEKCARLFEGELGVTFEGQPADGPTELVGSDRGDAWGVDGFVSVAGPWQRVTPTTADVVARRYPTRDTRGEGEVAATVARLGAGRIAAVYGPVALTYSRTHHPYLREAIGRIAREVFVEPAVSVDAPPCVDVALRHAADGRLCVHLLNTAGLPLDNRTATDFIPELRDVRVTVRTDAKSARVVPSAQVLDVRPATREDAPSYATSAQRDLRGYVTVTVPRLPIHEVVVFE